MRLKNFAILLICVILVLVYWIPKLASHSSRSDVQSIHSSPDQTQQQNQLRNQKQLADLQKKAEAGNAESQLELSWAYYFGNDVPADMQKSLTWLKSAAENGVPEAQFQLGLEYFSGNAGLVDFNESVNWLERSLDNDYAPAGMVLGYMYDQGLGVTSESQKAQHFYSKAIKSFEKAATQGDFYALYTLTTIYAYGIGVKQDDAQKDRWFKELGRLYPEVVCSKDEDCKGKERLLLLGSGVVPLSNDHDNGESLKSAESGVSSVPTRQNTGARIANPLQLYNQAVLGLTPNNKSDTKNHAFKQAQFLARKDLILADELMGIAYESGNRNPGNVVHQDRKKAVEWLLIAAAMGNSTSNYILGLNYSEGQDIKNDQKMAAVFYRNARRLSEDILEKFSIDDLYASEIFELGLMYKFGKGVAPDDAKATKLLNSACHREFNANCHDLSEHYLSSRIWGLVGLDIQETLINANQGSASDQFKLINMLVMGYFLNPDPKSAFDYAQKFAQQGNKMAWLFEADFYRRGIGVQKDINQALRLYKAPLLKNNIEALIALGDIYEHGEGIPKDHEQASDWYKKAYEKLQILIHDHYSPAYAYMAYLYLNGYGVEKDLNAAVETYRLGVQQGDPGSQAGLGRLYMQGVGVNKDYDKAHSLLEKSLLSRFYFNNPGTYLAIIYLEGLGVQKDYSKARNLLSQSAVIKDPEALYRLGLMYRQGSNVSKNAQKAEDLILQACDLGYGEACPKN